MRRLYILSYHGHNRLPKAHGSFATFSYMGTFQVPINKVCHFQYDQTNFQNPNLLHYLNKYIVQVHKPSWHRKCFKVYSFTFDPSNFQKMYQTLQYDKTRLRNSIGQKIQLNGLILFQLRVSYLRTRALFGIIPNLAVEMDLDICFTGRIIRRLSVTNRMVFPKIFATICNYTAFTARWRSFESKNLCYTNHETDFKTNSDAEKLSYIRFPH